MVSSCPRALELCDNNLPLRRIIFCQSDKMCGLVCCSSQLTSSVSARTWSRIVCIGSAQGKEWLSKIGIFERNPIKSDRFHLATPFCDDSLNSKAKFRPLASLGTTGRIGQIGVNRPGHAGLHVWRRDGRERANIGRRCDRRQLPEKVAICV
jgi:hypothetical protein